MLCQSRAKPHKEEINLFDTHKPAAPFAFAEAGVPSSQPLLSAGLLSLQSHPDTALGLPGVCADEFRHLWHPPEPLCSARSSAGTILPPWLSLTKPARDKVEAAGTNPLPCLQNACVSLNNQLWFPAPPKPLFMKSKTKQHKHTCCKSLFRVQDCFISSFTWGFLNEYWTQAPSRFQFWVF